MQNCLGEIQPPNPSHRTILLISHLWNSTTKLPLPKFSLKADPWNVEFLTSEHAMDLDNVNRRAFSSEILNPNLEWLSYKISKCAMREPRPAGTITIVNHHSKISPWPRYLEGHLPTTSIFWYIIVRLIWLSVQFELSWPCCCAWLKSTLTNFNLQR